MTTPRILGAWGLGPVTLLVRYDFGFLGLGFELYIAGSVTILCEPVMFSLTYGGAHGG